jgi:serine/threonine-protein phosphatase 2B catalytic subunit
MAMNMFRREPNLLQLKDPVTVVGDIHGQFYDMIKMLEIGGSPETTRYLFLGDYVDRGAFSIEVVLLLYAIKVSFPSTVCMIRGNHECRQMTTFFNFRSEVMYKYDLEVYDKFMESFDMLPLACIVNNKFIALHGGISPELRTLDDINRLNRFTEPPRQGLYCDILWSDPVENDQGRSPDLFKSNEVRGCSYFFNVEAVNRFLRRNDLLSVIRAHEAQLDGYKMHRWNGNNEFPVVITIFSAPNYCDVYNNKAAVIKFENNTLNIQQFNYTSHPYMLPNFMDVFTWSIPFVIEKVTEMLYNILEPKSLSLPKVDETALLRIRELQAEVKEAKMEVDHKKVMFVGQLLQKIKQVREVNEQMVKTKDACPDDKIPRNILLQRSPMQNAMENFNQARRFDLVNEKMPEV